MPKPVRSFYWVLAALLVCATLPDAAFSKEDTKQAEIIKELDGLLLGPWSKLARGNNLKREHFVAAIKQCRSTRRLVKVDYQSGAKKELPAEILRRGNIVYYRTDSGLQRLDMALRQVVFVKTISRERLSSGTKVWTLGSPNGSLKLGFASNNKIKIGTKIPLMIEHNSIYLRCPQLNPS